MKRLVALLLGVVAATLESPSARADACADAFSSASELALRGQVIAARAALVQCSSDACPAAMRPLCVEDLGKVDRRVPSVVFAAVDDGNEAFDAQISVDGRVVAGRIDGRAVELDPGMHTFLVERGGRHSERSLVVREGEKDRVLSFDLTPPRAPLPPPAVAATRPAPWSVYAGGAATIVAAGLWAGFGIHGLADKSELDGCKGHCSESLISEATTSFRVADVAGLTTILGAIATTVLYVTRPVAVTVRPTPRGAALGVSATF